MWERRGSLELERRIKVAVIKRTGPKNEGKIYYTNPNVKGGIVARNKGKKPSECQQETKKAKRWINKNLLKID